MDSLQTKPKFDWKFDQTAQEEHRVATEAKLGATHELKSPQVSWCKNSKTIDGKPTLCLPPRNTFYMSMRMCLKALELCQVVHTT